MAKGYWIGRLEVSDPEKYKAYVAANAAAFRAYGGRFLVRGGQYSVVEGEARSRNVVVEFDDYAKAVACYHSPEYQAAKKLRDNISSGDLMIVEGYDGPQP